MTVTLSTPTPQYTSDIMDIIRVFFGAVKGISVRPPARGLVEHRFYETHNTWTCEFSMAGHGIQRSRPIPDASNAVKRRCVKRLIKHTLYLLLKEITSLHPPWGSLTGITPTQLYFECLADGLSPRKTEAFLVAYYDIFPEKAALLARVAEVQAKMSLPLNGYADVYIHIPFCDSICAYCSFPSGKADNGTQIKGYLSSLEIEIAETAALMKHQKLAPYAIYIGGGTPTSLSESSLQFLLQMVKTAFHDAVEVTFEAGRADSLTETKLRLLHDGFVTRICINPQTMNDKTLRVIGRNHTADDVIRVYQLSRHIGFANINMDIIAGLPGESLRDFSHTLNTVQQLCPESFTVHTLAIKRSSRMHFEKASLPNDLLVGAMLAKSTDTADRMGYKPYYLYRQKHMAGNLENIGYASDGYACAYNVDMMEDRVPIFGIGAGAVSKRLFAEESRIERAYNVSDVNLYTAQTYDMIERKKMLWA